MPHSSISADMSQPQTVCLFLSKCCDLSVKGGVTGGGKGTNNGVHTGVIFLCPNPTGRDLHSCACLVLRACLQNAKM